jgi:hypothetical protein
MPRNRRAAAKSSPTRAAGAGPGCAPVARSGGPTATRRAHAPRCSGVYARVGETRERAAVSMFLANSASSEQITSRPAARRTRARWRNSPTRHCWESFNSSFFPAVGVASGPPPAPRHCGRPPPCAHRARAGIFFSPLIVVRLCRRSAELSAALRSTCTKTNDFC